MRVPIVGRQPPDFQDVRIVLLGGIDSGPARNRAGPDVAEGRWRRISDPDWMRDTSRT
jgi:hypothetical protein